MQAADFPVWWANVAAVILFVGIAGAVFLVPREEILRDAPDQRWWRDYRLWAIPLVIVQLALYALFT